LVYHFLQEVSEKYDNPSLKHEDIYCHCMYEALGIPKEVHDEIIRKILKNCNLKLEDGSVEAIEGLNKKHKILIITSRPLNYEEPTKELLYNNSIKYSEIIFTKDINKGEDCQKNNVDVLIEDCLNVAINSSSLVEHVILYDKPWNQSSELDKNLFVRIHEWDEIFKYVLFLESI